MSQQGARETEQKTVGGWDDVIGVTIPLLAATLAAACSGDNGSTSTWDVAVPNDLVDAVRERPRVHRRRRSPSSTVTDFTTLADLKHVGPVPLSVYNACTLTWICTDPPLGPDIHANNDGYGFMAEAFAAVLGV